MITATMKMIVSPEKREELLKTVRLALEPIAVEPGCLSCRFYEDTVEDNTFILIQVWRSRPDLDRHLCDERFKILLAAMELLADPPEVEFHTISRVEGFEAVKAARMKQRKKMSLLKSNGTTGRAPSKGTRGSGAHWVGCPCGPIVDGRIGYGLRKAR